jgi:hypothetical protein
MNHKLREGQYYSLDTDSKGVFDFGSTKETPEDMKFSLVTAIQVFEHLEIQESIDLMRDNGDYEGLAHLAKVALEDTKLRETILRRAYRTAQENTYDQQIDIGRAFLSDYVEQ